MSTLNSGPLNAVPFPGAETGLSLIEVVGTVEVTAELSAVKLRLTSTATTAATADVPNVDVSVRSLLGASTATEAVVSAGVVTETPVALDPELATAVVSDVSAARVFRFAADTTASVSSSVAGLVFARNAASVSAEAVVSASADTEVPRSASTTASAFGTAATLRKVFRGAQTDAAAASSSHIVLQQRPGASTDATAELQLSALLYVRRGATALTEAVTSQPEAYEKALISLSPAFAVATALDIDAYQRKVTGAPGGVSALGSSGVALRFSLGAETLATVASAIAAADYGLLVNAPAERLMTVPPQDRRMEVTL